MWQRPNPGSITINVDGSVMGDPLRARVVLEGFVEITMGASCLGFVVT